MLDSLTEKFQKIFRTIKGEAKLTESNMREALREIKLSLLEADVNYLVVKEFVEKVKEKASGQEVMESFSPHLQMIKIVRDELLSLFGDGEKKINFSNTIPSIFLITGLQGSGKTTSSGKLALFLKNQNEHPLLASLDLKRPAAQDQLRIIADAVKVPFYEVKEKNLENAVRELITYSRNSGFTPLIIDTAGRLHIDEELMDELAEVKNLTQPSEVFYVADSMTGQDAVKSAKAFDEKVGITSIILTKLDGDQRGGAALSIVSITGKPIKFIGVGEKYADFEHFYPDRLVSRILGMGDMMSLVEKAEKTLEKKKAEELTEKILKKSFTLEDFREQLAQIKKLGSLESVLSYFPVAGPFKNLSKMNVDEKKILHMEAIINSMTKDERIFPERIDGRRRLRIAKGSGRPVQEVNQLLKNFFEMKKLMKKPSFKSLLKSFSNLNH